MKQSRRVIPIVVPRGSISRFSKGKGRGKKSTTRLATTTLWNHSSHNYGSGFQGDQQYIGATPAFIPWNLMQRYTKAGDVVVDPFCGSGTTLDVAAELERRAVGFDVAPYRPGIHRADAREIPLDDEIADLVFIDPPYADNVKYSNEKTCLGRYKAGDSRYYKGLEMVLGECKRILKPGGVFACYVCDHYSNKTGFEPIGFRILSMIQERFELLDIVAVVRHNKKLKEGIWQRGARRGGFLMRGFNYLFIAKRKGQKLSHSKSGKPNSRGRKSADCQSTGCKLAGRNSTERKPATRKSTNRKPSNKKPSRPRADERKPNERKPRWRKSVNKKSSKKKN